MKIFYTLIALVAFQITTSICFAQVSKLKYQLEYNAFDSSYAVYIKIIEGSSKTAPQRAQFNSQISFVTPTGHSFKINKNYMPLQGNNSPNTSTTPLQWTISSTVIDPAALPNHDFTSITPTLSPTSFYNILNPDDEIKLFSFKISPMPADPNKVRFFDNEKDPKSNQAGMGGGDFRNIFTLGGIQEDYSGNLPLRIKNTVATNEFVQSNIKVYPNPVSNTFTIESSSEIQNYNMIDTNGKSVLTGKSNQVDCSTLPTGMYLLELTLQNSKEVKKIIKL